MMSRGARRAWLLPLISGLLLAAVPACVPVSSVKLDEQAVISYSTVDSGILKVNVGKNPISEEAFTLEKGTDGTWVAAAKVTPVQPDAPVRDVRLELTKTYRPLTYSEEQAGANGLKVFISFGEDSASITVKQGEAAENNKTISGKFDVFTGDQLWHHPGLLARAYAEMNSTEPKSFTLFGDPGLPVQIKEEASESFDSDGKSMEARHFVLDVDSGKLTEHVWLAKADLKMLRLELYTPGPDGKKKLRQLSASRGDIPGSETLSLIKKAPAAPAAPATPTDGSAPAAAPAPGAAPAPAPAPAAAPAPAPAPAPAAPPSGK